MSALIWDERPVLHEPVIIAAFAGWNDAGDAATGTVRFLIDQINAVSFAHIDAETFFDFTQTRPTVHMENGAMRRIEWPLNVFSYGKLPGTGRDVILLEGTEPQLQWRTFTAAITELATELGATTAITLGALLADVPHTRPAPLSGNATDFEVLERLNIPASRYEGPTGITGVVNDALARTGMNNLSLWSSVPHYVSTTSSPKATQALTQKVAEFLDTPIDLSTLQLASTIYEAQVTEVIDEDEDMIEYVNSLEETHTPDGNDIEQLAKEAERFLRDQD